MPILISRNYSIIADLVDEYVKPDGPALGRTKRELAEYASQCYGYREGIAYALAASAQMIRLETYPLSEHLEIIFDHEIKAILDPYRLDWAGTDQAVKERWMGEIAHAIYELARGDEAMRDRYAVLRREKFKAGFVSASELTDIDKEILRKEAETMREQSIALEGLLSD